MAFNGGLVVFLVLDSVFDGFFLEVSKPTCRLGIT